MKEIMFKNGSIIEFTQEKEDKIKFKSAYKGIFPVPNISEGYIYWMNSKEYKKLKRLKSKRRENEGDKV